MDYKQEIRGYVAEHFLPGGQGLEDTTPLISGGLIDSIGMLGLISFMESRFGWSSCRAKWMRTHWTT